MNYMIIPGMKEKVFVEGLIDPEIVFKAVAKHYGITVSDIKSKCRKSEIVKARQIVCLFLKQYAGMKLTEIGKLIHENYGHYGVIYSVDKLNEMMAIYPGLKHEVARVFDVIRAAHSDQIMSVWKEEPEEMMA